MRGRPPKPVVDGKMFCRHCQDWKPVTDFYKNSHRANGRNNHCKICIKAEVKIWKQNHPGTDDIYRYGITKDEKDKLLDRQGGRCACCNRIFLSRQSYDMQRKALVCPRCANGLAYFRDKDFVKKMGIYLAGRP